MARRAGQRRLQRVGPASIVLGVRGWCAHDRKRGQSTCTCRRRLDGAPSPKDSCGSWGVRGPKRSCQWAPARGDYDSRDYVCGRLATLMHDLGTLVAVGLGQPPCHWRKPGKLRPSYDVGVFPRMSAKQGAQRGQSEADPPPASAICRSSAPSVARTSRSTTWRDALVATRRSRAACWAASQECCKSDASLGSRG